MRPDSIALEEPLELRLGVSLESVESISVLMRTPGEDTQLAIGFVISEGLLDPNSDSMPDIESNNGVVTILLDEADTPDISALKRNFFASSSCGICGKASIAAVMDLLPPRPLTREFVIPSARIAALCEEMRAAQHLFDRTGAVHAAGLFDIEGQIILVKEDVGRHNALDKVIGAAYQQGLLNERAAGFCVSGRAGFELMQKTAMAGLKMLISVGAPTSLSVEFASANTMTLVGFVSSEGYNIYSGDRRIS